MVLDSKIFDYCSFSRQYKEGSAGTMTDMCSRYPEETELLVFFLTALVVIMIIMGIPIFYIQMWKFFQGARERHQLRRIRRYAALITAARPTAGPVEPEVPVVPVAIPRAASPVPAQQVVAQPAPVVAQPVAAQVPSVEAMRIVQSPSQNYYDDLYDQFRAAPPSYERAVFYANPYSYATQNLRLEMSENIMARRNNHFSHNGSMYNNNYSAGSSYANPRLYEVGSTTSQDAQGAEGSLDDLFE